MKRFLLLLLFFFHALIYANTIDVSSQSNIYVGEKTLIYEDSDSQETIDTIVEKQGLFKPLGMNVHSSIFTSSTFWYKLTIHNPTPTNVERYFVFDLPWIDNINIYTTNQTYHIGNMLPFEKRSIKTNLLNQKHTFKSGTTDVYIQVKTRDPFITPLSLLSYERLLEKLFKEHTLELAVFGIILAMLIFNLILYFLIKRRVYIFYVLFLLSYLLMSSAYNNYSYMYILPNSPETQNWLQSIGIFIFSICGLLFTQSFLDLKKYHTKLNHYTNRIIAVYILLLFSGVFISYALHVALSIFLTVCFSLYAISLGFYSYFRGNQSALFFILGTTFGLIGTSITALNALSIIPYDWFFFKAVDFGIVIDSVLLSVALANRFNLLYTSLQKTEEKLLLLNEELEEKIKERTNHLALEVNNKQILLQEMSHRVKNNLQIISALFEMEGNKINDEKAKEVIAKNIKRIKSMALLYEKFLDSDDLEHIPLEDYINDVLIEFENTFSTHHITYNVKIAELYCDSKRLIPIGLVINELVTNSIKYAFFNTNEAKLNINITKENENIKIVYADNGKGAKEEIIKKGFGFKLLNALVVHQLRGSLHYENKNGVCFTIFIPQN